QTETEATGAPQKHHYTLNQQVGSITTNTGIFLKQSAVSLRSKFSDFTGKGGANTDSPSYRFI
ncbi:hypothetical protein, partial [Klebsiella pneumoniae]|uniref:hypothetical protein n=1 Tax=Klebsiella pneumoniae TaxID=573 RepID=UPI001F4AACBB